MSKMNTTKTGLNSNAPLEVPIDLHFVKYLAKIYKRGLRLALRWNLKKILCGIERFRM